MLYLQRATSTQFPPPDPSGPEAPSGPAHSGPGPWLAVQGPDVDAGQREPGQRKLPPGAVVLELDVQEEVSGVEEEQRADAQRALFGLHLQTEERKR